MATDVGRVRSAIGGIHAVTVSGSEKSEALEALYRLEVACKYAKTEARRPEFLQCLADYQDAPLGTVVAKRHSPGWWLKHVLGWVDENGTLVHGPHLDVVPRMVVRWGDE